VRLNTRIMPHGGVAIVREFEAATAQAKTVEEAKELSAQYLDKHRQEVVSKLDRTRNEANKHKSEGSKLQAEIQRLREALSSVASELDARAPRLAKADLESLRAIVKRALVVPARAIGAGNSGALSPRSELSPRSQSYSDIQSPRQSPTATPSNAFSFRSVNIDGTNAGIPGFAIAAGGTKLSQHASGIDSTNLSVDDKPRAAGTMQRLRQRIEQLEKAQASLKKENEKLRIERAHGPEPSSPSQMVGSSSAQISRKGSAGGNARSPQAGTSVMGSSPQLRSPRRSPGPSNGRAVNTTTEEAVTESQVGERERLLGMIRRLEKEQVEQQQYADKVVNELGTALKALEGENTSLQTDLRQGGRKAGAEADARKRLERQVRSLETEKDVLTRQVVTYRGSTSIDYRSDAIDADHAQATLTAKSSVTTMVIDTTPPSSSSLQGQAFDSQAIARQAGSCAWAAPLSPSSRVAVDTIANDVASAVAGAMSGGAAAEQYQRQPTLN